MDVCRDEAASLADLCANEHLVALFDQSFGGSADMLAHEDAYLRGQRHRDRFACSSCLVMRRMRANRPHAHAGALVQGQQLLNMFIVSFWRGKSTTMAQK